MTTEAPGTDFVMHTSPTESVALVATRANIEKREPARIAAKQISQDRSAEAASYRPGAASDIDAKILAAFPDAPVMLKVAHCESGVRFKDGSCGGPINPQADNPSSTAYGVFQILKGTWADYGCTGDRGNADDNIACARKIYDESKLRPWKASESAWSR